MCYKTTKKKAHGQHPPERSNVWALIKQGQFKQDKQNFPLLAETNSSKQNGENAVLMSQQLQTYSTILQKKLLQKTLPSLPRKQTSLIFVH